MLTNNNYLLLFHTGPLNMCGKEPVLIYQNSSKLLTLISHFNGEQIIQEIAIDGTVTQVRSGSNRASLLI